MVEFLYLRVERVEQAFRPAACCIVGSAALAAEVRPSGAEGLLLSCLNAGLKPCSTPFSRAFRLFMRWLLVSRGARALAVFLFAQVSNGGECRRFLLCDQ